MGRKKGSLTPEQKAKMQAGRKRASEKAQEGLIGSIEVKVKKQKEVEIIGYGIDIGEHEIPYPIFKSESYNGKIYSTLIEAKEARK